MSTLKITLITTISSLLLVITPAMSIASPAKNSQKDESFSHRDIWLDLYKGPSPPLVDPNLAHVIKEAWISQPLDHFDKTNKKIWQMVGVKEIRLDN